MYFKFWDSRFGDFGFRDLGYCWLGDLGFRDIAPTMAHQMAKNIGHEMQTVVLQWLYNLLPIRRGSRSGSEHGNDVISWDSTVADTRSFVNRGEVIAAGLVEVEVLGGNSATLKTPSEVAEAMTALNPKPYTMFG